MKKSRKPTRRRLSIERDTIRMLDPDKMIGAGAGGCDTTSLTSDHARPLTKTCIGCP